MSSVAQASLYLWRTSGVVGMATYSFPPVPPMVFVCVCVCVYRFTSAMGLLERSLMQCATLSHRLITECSIGIVCYF